MEAVSDDGNSGSAEARAGHMATVTVFPGVVCRCTILSGTRSMPATSLFWGRLKTEALARQRGLNLTVPAAVRAASARCPVPPNGKTGTSATGRGASNLRNSV